MAERPILFSAPMVRAILEGRKTQTRRVVKPQPPVYSEHLRPSFVDPIEWIDQDGSDFSLRSPYGQLGDRLWLRETWAASMFYGKKLRLPAECAPDEMVYGRIFYKADGDAWSASEQYRNIPSKLVTGTAAWRPSIHMPRWASRITLEVVSVRVERLQDISETDAIAEGVEAPEAEFGGFDNPHSVAFRNLWDSINAKRAPWVSNPWVWCVEFKRVEVPRG